MTQSQITNAQLASATTRLVPPNGFIATAMADRTGPPAPSIVPISTPASQPKIAKISDAAAERTEIAVTKPSLILAGLDNSGKAHASAFLESECEAAKAAAALSGFSVIEVNSDALVELAVQLPKGKIYDSGKAFVPFVKADLFQTLASHHPLIAQKPRDFSLPKGMTVEHKNIINKAEPVGDRSKPKLGSMYLAYDDESWYEAVVVEIHDNGTLTLRWRDFDEEAPFTFRADQLGLLPPELPVTE